jgi:hypothetical protein
VSSIASICAASVKQLLSFLPSRPGLQRRRPLDAGAVSLVGQQGFDHPAQQIVFEEAMRPQLCRREAPVPGRLCLLAYRPASLPINHSTAAGELAISADKPPRSASISQPLAVCLPAV